MIPASFEYFSPKSLSEAVSLATESVEDPEREGCGGV